MGKYYRFNYKGNLLAQKTFDEIVRISNIFPEYSCVRKGKKWGVVDTNTLETIVDIKFDRLSLEPSFNNSVVVVGWLNEKTYLLDINNDDIVSDIYDKIYFKSNSDFGVTFKDNLSGITSIDNKIIFEPEYLSCKVLEQNLFLLQKEGIFYLGNEKREILNKIECQSILPVVQYTDKVGVLTYFTFKLKDKFGLLDANLNIIIPANYETLEVNKFGKIYAQIDRADFELSNTGQVLNKLEHTLRYSTSFDSIKISDNNYNYLVSKDETYKSKRGILDNDYKLVLPIEYDWIIYSNGVWVVRKGRSEYLLDENFKLIPNVKYKEIGNFDDDGVACAQDENYKYHFINIFGKVLSKHIFDRIYLNGYSFNYNTFISGLWAVMLNSKWGFVDKKGSLIIECIFDEIRNFDKQNTAVVKKNGKWGVIDIHGKHIIPFDFDEFNNFDKRNSAIVKKNGKWGVIDTHGKSIINFNFDCIINYDLDNKLILTALEDKFGVIDFDNNIIIPIAYDYISFFNEDLITGYSKKTIPKGVN